MPLRSRLRRALWPLVALCPALQAARLGAQLPQTLDSAHVIGRVHTGDGTPVSGIHIDLAGTSYHATTSDSGTFALSAVAPGRYTLVAHAPRWTTASTSITARTADTTYVDLTVSPTSATSATTPNALPTIEIQGRANSPTPSGPSLSATGAADYSVDARDIASLPSGENTYMTDVLAQMPGVAIDQNQQIHIRNTEGPQFQYQINGALVPLDINTNPPFVSMFNPMFVSRLDLIDGVLPSRYSYATGGVVAIETRDGCRAPGGQASTMFGQRLVVEGSLQYAGCAGKASFFVSGEFDDGENAFSSATPGPAPVHDAAHGGQALGYLSVPLGSTVELGALVSVAGSNNQLPNVPNLRPLFVLGSGSDPNSALINSHLNFRDYLGMLTLSGQPTSTLRYRVTYAAHAIDQAFDPDDSAELIFQGVASTASHNDADNTLQGDLTDVVGRHQLSLGFYVGEYDVVADDRSLVFPVDSNGTPGTTPVTVINDAHAVNVVSGVYVGDLWQLDTRLAINLGLRWDDLTGFTSGNQLDPTLNLIYHLGTRTTVHGGFARYMQVPSFQGISPTATAAFAGTTAAGSSGISTPFVEDDFEWDVGVVQTIGRRFTLAEDAYYEITDHYLDTGQFGVVPIFAPFNYERGQVWGSETAVSYRGDDLSAYANLTIGRNLQEGVVTGQFNFAYDELTYIDDHYIVLDHQPLYGASAGGSWRTPVATLGLDGIYSSGLRAGFADLVQLPNVVQINASARHDFPVAGLGTLSSRITILNLLDRVNLIRPAEGIGIFQSAYGPRFTLLGTVSFAF